MFIHDTGVLPGLLVVSETDVPLELVTSPPVLAAIVSLKISGVEAQGRRVA